MASPPRSNEQMLNQNGRVASRMCRFLREPPEAVFRQEQHIPEEARFLHPVKLIPSVLQARHVAEVIHHDVREDERPCGFHDILECNGGPRCLVLKQVRQVAGDLIHEGLDGGVTWLGKDCVLTKLDGVGRTGPDGRLVVVVFDADDQVDRIPVLCRNPPGDGLVWGDVDVGLQTAFLQQDEVSHKISLENGIRQVCEGIGEGVIEPFADVGVHVVVREALVPPPGICRSPFVRETDSALRWIF